MYLKEIGRISLLSPDEELDLSIRVAEGDEEAKNILAECNLRLVIIAKRYVGRAFISRFDSRRKYWLNEGC